MDKISNFVYRFLPPVKTGKDRYRLCHARGYRYRAGVIKH